MSKTNPKLRIDFIFLCGAPSRGIPDQRVQSYKLVSPEYAGQDPLEVVRKLSHLPADAIVEASWDKKSEE